MSVPGPFDGMALHHADKVEVALRQILAASVALDGWADQGVHRQPDPNVLPHDAPPFISVGCIGLSPKMSMNRRVVQIGRFRVAAIYEERRVVIADTELTAKSLLPHIAIAVMANPTLRVAQFSNADLVEDAPVFLDVDFGQAILHRDGLPTDAPIVGRFMSQIIQFEWPLNRTTWLAP